MKKIFSLLAAVLFAGSMMAAEKTVTYVFTTKSWAATMNDAAANWISNKDGGGFSNNGVQVTTSYSGANATSPDSYNQISKIVVTYNTNKSAGKGTFDVKIGDNEKVNKEWKYNTGDADGRIANYETEFTYDTPQTGEVTLTANTTTNSVYVVSIAITYNEDASAPVLKADKIDLGLVVISDKESEYVLDTNLVVTAANLTAPIAVTNSAHVTAAVASLPAEGGTLNLHIVAPVGELKDTIVLASGEKSIKVAIVGNVKQAVVLPGIPAKMETGDASMEATVNGLPAIKAGTGSNAGSMKITVPANTIKLHFYAVAWKDEAGDLSIAAPEGVTLDKSAVALSADDGISGSGSDYLLKTLVESDCAFHISLNGVTEETVITLSRPASKNRFAVWGATYELGEATAIENTAVEAKAFKTFENGQLVIIKNGVKYDVTGAVIR
ncbi:MAG: hypothetical protein K6E29_08490 [Cyanobacteria bacterium RUI128]|nr:hypothetical protein [Cyanobacteria bacterium RUI128]